MNLKTFFAHQLYAKDNLNLIQIHLMKLTTVSSVCLNLVIPHSIFNTENLSHKGGELRSVSPTTIYVLPFEVVFSKSKQLT